MGILYWVMSLLLLRWIMSDPLFEAVNSPVAGRLYALSGYELFRNPGLKHGSHDLILNNSVEIY